jgi:SNF2 family DNA or RNA helicase
MNLRPYQETAADFLYEHDRAMILAPVGAGKTAITLTAMYDMLYEGHAKRFLVVAPLRVATSVWPVEQPKWAPFIKMRVAVGTPNARAAALYSDADVVVTNYDNLQWLAEQNLSLFDAIVFDELTRLKNPSGKRFKALQKVIKDVEVRWGLTGSFTSNGLEDVFGQCKVIDQSLLGRSKGAFMQQYFYQNNRGTHTEWEPRPGSLPAVMQRIKPATFVLEPGEYKDKLPPLHTVEMPCSMVMDDYNTMKKDFVLQFGDETTIAQNAAVVTQKLQQMSSGFLYTDNGPRWLSSHKFDVLDEILSENQHANTIVVYNYVEELNELRRRYPTLAAMDEKWDVIAGWNAGQVRLLAIHPKSAGHGLNLQHGGHHIIWLSLPWSLELYEQTIGRLHRSGQTHDVWNYVLLTADTVDRKIWSALHDKQSLSQLALEALK